MDPAENEPPRDHQPLEPAHVPSRRIVEWGMAGWAVALAVILLVPDLRSGDRAWWPWCCVAGLALGALGWTYVRRGRGNAIGADH